MKKILSLIFAIMLFSNILIAREIESIYGEDNNFVGLLDLEMEQGLAVSRDSSKQGDISYVPIRLSYGVMKNFEAGIKLPYAFVKNGDEGFADISIYQKFKFLEQETNGIDMSGGLDFNLPTSKLDNQPLLSNNKLDFKIFLTAGKTLQKIRVFGSLGFNFLSGGDDTEIDYDAGFNFVLTNSFKFIGELYGRDNDLISEAYISPALIFTSKRNVDLKLSFPIGINDDAFDYIINFSVVHTF